MGVGCAGVLEGFNAVPSRGCPSSFRGVAEVYSKIAQPNRREVG